MSTWRNFDFLRKKIWSQKKLPPPLNFEVLLLICNILQKKVLSAINVRVWFKHKNIVVNNALS